MDHAHTKTHNCVTRSCVALYYGHVCRKSADPIWHGLAMHAAAPHPSLTRHAMHMTWVFSSRKLAQK